jgi:APA family basic amino acid/polyamine antiporter
MAEVTRAGTPAAHPVAEEPIAAPAGLPRRIGMLSCAAIVAGTIIGSGIFRTPADIASTVGSVGGIAAVWIIGGLVTICLALCLAELATMFPRSGGVYVYLREAYGPTMAFVFGWTFLLINPANWAAIALIFGEYAGSFAQLGETGKRVLASAIVAFVCTANYISVRFAASIQNFATSAKALALAAIALVIFFVGSGSNGALAEPITFTAPSLGAFGVALIAVLWPYEGVAGACAISGEVRDPGRSLPRALILSVVVVMVLYLLINAAYLYVLPLSQVSTSGLVAADAMQAVTGPKGAAVVAACVMLSTFGAVAAASISDPRVFYAMARDGLFFKRIGAVHPKFQTPHVAIVVSGALAIAYLWVRSFEELAAQFVLGLWLFYTLAVVGLLILRVRQPNTVRPYRTFGYPLVPVVFVLGAGSLLLNSLVELPKIALANLAVTFLGVPVYFLWKRLARPPKA